jgi:diacylglycerol O-acyltransferase
MGTVRVSIAIFSYCGRLFFGITGDYDTVTDIDVLRDGIEDGMRELVGAADRATEVAGRKRAARSPRRSRPRSASPNGQAAVRSGKR